MSGLTSISPPYIGLPSTALTATAATSAFLDAITLASVALQAGGWAIPETSPGSEQVGDGLAVLLHGGQVIAHGPAGDALVRAPRVGAVDGGVRHAGCLPGLELPA